MQTYFQKKKLQHPEVCKRFCASADITTPVEKISLLGLTCCTETCENAKCSPHEIAMFKPRLRVQTNFNFWMIRSPKGGIGWTSSIFFARTCWKSGSKTWKEYSSSFWTSLTVEDGKIIILSKNRKVLWDECGLFSRGLQVVCLAASHFWGVWNKQSSRQLCPVLSQLNSKVFASGSTFPR